MPPVARRVCRTVFQSERGTVTSEIVEAVEVEKLAHGGDGLGFLPDGRVVFVQRAVPGDVVDIELIEDKDSWARARVTELREKSEARVDSECDAYERGCGGCQFWNIGYERELEWKVDAAHESMERIAGVELPDPEVVQAPSVRDYRNRVTYHQRRRGGGLVRGFYAQGTRRVVEVDQCPVARPVIDEAIAELGGVVGLLGDADITVETADEATAVLLVELKGRSSVEDDHLEEIARRVDQGVAVRGVEIMADEDEHYVIGDTTVEAEEVLARPPVEGMRVESGRFRQANAAVNRRMVDRVVDIVDASWDQPRVLELFCGAGNFSFPVAKIAQRVVGYEASEGAVATGRRMAELAGMDEEIEFDVADLSVVDVVDQVLETPFEVLILDPPREGASVAVKRFVQRRRAGQVVYVACAPAVLARDTETLVEAGWEIERLMAFDMFPRTSHLEMVAVFDRHPDS